MIPCGFSQPMARLMLADSGDLLTCTLGSAGGLLPLHAARPREALGNQHGHLPYQGWSDLDDAAPACLGRSGSTLKTNQPCSSDAALPSQMRHASMQPCIHASMHPCLHAHTHTVDSRFGSVVRFRERFGAHVRFIGSPPTSRINILVFYDTFT